MYSLVIVLKMFVFTFTYTYIHIHLHTNVHPDASMYSEALRFQDRPDYAYLRRLFKELFSKEGG